MMRIFAVNAEAKTLKVVRLVFAGHKCGIGEFSENMLLRVFYQFYSFLAVTGARSHES
ncbi:hypothetical protein [Pedobacter agri]|uniref:Uncharacterized protein n=1 Tax=Pedobacter agri TaxID=454586 RepID=A0A9X3I8P7_9SPHI|nr:hypothetical protein [Pedobacter agri]MCX3264209.1 hypothetical protein [Pedobacter agri]